MNRRGSGISPLVTVLMSVYNGEKYLREAVDSILAQTFEDFEFLIVDDGSVDRSREILDSCLDPRIRLLPNERNLGLPESLNRGLDLASGKYVARMDCDDVSLPDRLACQVEFMESMPEVGVCGSWARTIGHPEGEIYRLPGAPELVKCRFLFENAVIHPSAMLRTSFFRTHALRYDPEYRCSQDYDIWVRASRFFRVANVEKVLLLYRLHERQVRNLNPSGQKAASSRIQCFQLRNFLQLDPSEEELRLHESLAWGDCAGGRDFFRKADAWLRKIADANGRTRFYGESCLNWVLKEQGARAVSCALEQDASIFDAPPDSPWVRFTWRQKAKLLLAPMKRNLTRFPRLKALLKLLRDRMLGMSLSSESKDRKK